MRAFMSSGRIQPTLPEAWDSLACVPSSQMAAEREARAILAETEGKGVPSEKMERLCWNDQSTWLLANDALAESLAAFIEQEF